MEKQVVNIKSSEKTIYTKQKQHNAATPMPASTAL